MYSVNLSDKILYFLNNIDILKRLVEIADHLQNECHQFGKSARRPFELAREVSIQVFYFINYVRKMHMSFVQLNSYITGLIFAVFSNRDLSNYSIAQKKKKKKKKKKKTIANLFSAAFFLQQNKILLRL